jgi:hypothetical protein
MTSLSVSDMIWIDGRKWKAITRGQGTVNLFVAPFQAFNHVISQKTCTARPSLRCVNQVHSHVHVSFMQNETVVWYADTTLLGA